MLEHLCRLAIRSAFIHRSRERQWGSPAIAILAAFAIGSKSQHNHTAARRFPLIVDALAALRSRSCIIDGEAVACGDDVRKVTLASVLVKASAGLRLNEHLEHEDGAIVFRHACKMGREGSPAGFP